MSALQSRGTPHNRSGCDRLIRKKAQQCNRRKRHHVDQQKKGEIKVNEIERTAQISLNLWEKGSSGPSYWERLFQEGGGGALGVETETNMKDAFPSFPRERLQQPSEGNSPVGRRRVPSWGSQKEFMMNRGKGKRVRPCGEKRGAFTRRQGKVSPHQKRRRSVEIGRLLRTCQGGPGE